MSWRDDAACIGLEDIFVVNEDSTAAWRVCQTCPVTDPCLEDALGTPASEDVATVRGGLTPKQRSALRKTRKGVAA